MSRLLKAPDGKERILAPLTSVAFAQRMLSCVEVIRKTLPSGLHVGPAAELLMRIYLVEGSSSGLAVEQLAIDLDGNISTIKRWIALLTNMVLVERHDGLLVLSFEGLLLVERVIDNMFAAQRALD